MSALAENLRRLRKLANLTQADLAEAAGLPRATVASLEQPDANPSLATTLAVAKALDVTIDDLTTPGAGNRIFTVHPDEQQEYRAEGGRYLARLVSPIASKGVQLHHVTLQPGCRSVGRPHPQGAQEFFLTLDGLAVITIDRERCEVPAGSLIQFPGHRKHTYENPGTSICRAVSVVAFKLD